MSGAFISPRVSEPFEHDGIVFKVRSLTAEEKMPILFMAKAGTKKIIFGPEAFKIAVNVGLVGWNVKVPNWSKDSMTANLARLSDSAYLAIGKKILDLSFISEEAKLNLESPSKSPQPDDGSTVAEK
jgi:hypothetical protein